MESEQRHKKKRNETRNETSSQPHPIYPCTPIHPSMRSYYYDDKVVKNILRYSCIPGRQSLTSVWREKKVTKQKKWKEKENGRQRNEGRNNKANICWRGKGRMEKSRPTKHQLRRTRDETRLWRRKRKQREKGNFWRTNRQRIRHIRRKGKRVVSTGKEDKSIQLVCPLWSCKLYPNQ